MEINRVQFLCSALESEFLKKSALEIDVNEYLYKHLKR